MALTSASRPTFFMKRSDRLIARLQHLFHGMRFAKQVDGQMIMVWTPLPTFFHQFDTSEYHIDRIFDIREYYANGGYKDLIFFHSVAPFPKGLKSLQDPEYETARRVGFSRAELSEPDFLGYSGIYVNFKFEDEHKSPSTVSEEVRTIFRSIPLEATVRRILDSARAMIKTETYTALHVRQGDVGQMIRRDLPELAKGNLDSKQLALTIGHYLGRTAPYSFYYDEIQRSIEKGSNILFSSDSPETLKHFTAKFGSRHFVDVNRFVRARFPIQKAFMDFCMLAGAEKIISTGSTYASFASVLGGSELVNVARNGTLDERVSFLTSEFAPDLVGNAAVGKALTDEVVRISTLKSWKYLPSEEEAATTAEP